MITREEAIEGASLEAEDAVAWCVQPGRWTWGLVRHNPPPWQCEHVLVENAVQTFLPYPDFVETARVLDPRRLGNQFYREGLTLLRSGWPRHPAAVMWRGYRGALCRYLLALAGELQRRGHSYPGHVAEVCSVLALGDTGDPPWLGGPIHVSHRSNLLRKDPAWYGRFGWTEPDDLPYIWPT